MIIMIIITATLKIILIISRVIYETGWPEYLSAPIP